MKAIVLTKNYAGSTERYNHLGGKYIGGAEVYLHELITGVLTRFFDDIVVYARSAADQDRDAAFRVLSLSSLERGHVKSAQLLIINRLDDLPLLMPWKSPITTVAIHHGFSTGSPPPWQLRGILTSNQIMTRKPATIGQTGRSILRAAREYLGSSRYLNDCCRFVDQVISVDRWSTKFCAPFQRDKWSIIPNF